MRELEAGQVIYDIGDELSAWCLVLIGGASVTVKNPLIEDWQWARSIFEGLEQWKTKVFDKKVNKEMQISLLKAKLQADTKQLQNLKTFNKDKQAMRSK